MSSKSPVIILSETINILRKLQKNNNKKHFWDAPENVAIELCA